MIGQSKSSLWTPLSCDKMVGCWHINSILVFIILNIKIALINCSWSKAPSKAAKNNGVMALIRAQLGVPWPERGQREVRTSSPGSQVEMGKFGSRHVFPMLRVLHTPRSQLYMYIYICVSSWCYTYMIIISTRLDLPYRWSVMWKEPSLKFMFMSCFPQMH